MQEVGAVREVQVWEAAVRVVHGLRLRLQPVCGSAEDLPVGLQAPVLQGLQLRCVFLQRPHVCLLPVERSAHPEEGFRHKVERAPQDLFGMKRALFNVQILVRASILPELCDVWRGPKPAI
jgi:hypothetical protein